MSGNAVSVVTVTFNNAVGLSRTLSSLAVVAELPLEIVIVDGGSTDATDMVVGQFLASLPLRYLSEKDEGIYDAMNKGRRLTRGRVIHYLNAGDEVMGNPYGGIDSVTDGIRLPVTIVSEGAQCEWRDWVKLAGFGYCHQGVLLPADHGDYDARYTIAADVDVLMRTCPFGIDRLPVSRTGEVRYHLGGTSTKNAARANREIISIFRRQKGMVYGLFIASMLAVKSLVPRQVRKGMARRWRARAARRHA